MRLDDLLPILGVPFSKFNRQAVLQLASKFIRFPITAYSGLDMNDAVLASYAIYGSLFTPYDSVHKDIGQNVLSSLASAYEPLQVSYVRGRTGAIILDEQDKLRIPPGGVRRADLATQARYHLISRASKGHTLREAEHIYQASLHAPHYVPSDYVKKLDMRAEEIYQTFSRMPAHLF